MITDTLFIRLGHAGPSESVSWCLRQAGTGYGHVQQGALEDALLLARSRRVVVLLPSTDINLTSMELPPQLLSMPQAKLLQAIPYQLEDKLAEDVDSLHFALGRRGTGNRLPVAIVAREKLQGWLAAFRERGVTPDAMVPDMLCLPLIRDTVPVWSVLLEDGHATVRSDLHSGFSSETEMLADFLTLTEAPNNLRLQIYPVEHSELPVLERPVQTAASVKSGLEYLMRGFDEQQAINLLQGEYALAPDYLTWFKPWRMTAALLASWLALATATLAIENLRQRHELRQLEATAESAFRSTFPQVTTVIDLRGQAQQQLASLKRTGGVGGFLPLLEGSSAVLARVNGLQLQELQFREGSLRLAMVASDTQALDNLQQGFAQQPGLRLEVESANASGQGVQIRAVVKAKS